MRKVVYVTDPEGNLGYFQQCLARSNGAYVEDGEIVLQKDWVLVFGGDVCDKAVGSLAIARMLVAAKKRQPDRVFIIAGNRDLNKLRLRNELTDVAMGAEPPLPYGAPKTTMPYADFLAKLAAEKGLHKAAAGPLPPAVHATLNTKPNRLRWILDHTMGAAGDFERRRTELQQMRGSALGEVGDEAVVASYLESVADGGVMVELLRHAHLVVGVDETLFVHGGLMSASFSGNRDKFVTELPSQYTGPATLVDGSFELALGCVPGMSERVMDVKAWAEKLNGWFSRAVADSLLPNGGRQPNVAIAQQYGTYGTWPSVITARHLNDKSQPVPLPPTISRQLLEAGYTRLVVGHTPHGNCPTVVPGAVQTIMADTSYSNMKAADNRGDAVSVVEIEGTRASILGCLEDKAPIAYTVYSGDDAQRTELDDNDVLIGRGDYANWWVKARLSGTVGDAEREYLLCHVEGFKYDYKRMPESQVRKELNL